MASVRFAFVIVCTILIFLSSCKKEEAPVVDTGYDYFPMELGRYVSYNVDSIFTDLDVKIADTLHFQVKERVDSLYENSEGNTVARLQRFYRSDSTEEWQLRDIWTMTKTSTRAEKLEENVPFVRMAFSVLSSQAWDGNAFNQLDEWEHSYAGIGTSKNVGGIDYAETVDVIQRNETLLTRIEYGREIYAKHVGMVFKQLDTFNTVFPTSEVSLGVKIQMTAFDNGVE